MYSLNGDLKYSTANQTSLEITKSIKNDFYGAVCPVYDGEAKVKKRTNTKLSFLRSEDEWKRTLDRREAQKAKGFFSHFSQPYNELGKTELVAKDLVVKAMKDIGVVFKTETDSEETDETTSSELPNEKLPTKEEARQPSPKRVEDSSEEHDNGSLTIKDLLHKAEQRIKFVQAGQPLEQYLQEEGERKKQLQLKHKELQARCSSGMLYLETPDEFSEEEIDVDPLTRNKRQQDSRFRKAFLAKLQCLETIFCCVLNTKNKDLRSKVPLSREALRSIRRAVSVEGPQGIYAVSRQPRMSAIPAIIFSSNRNHRLPSSNLNDSDSIPAAHLQRPNIPACLDDNQSAGSKVHLNPNEAHVGKTAAASLHASKNLVHLTASASRISQPYAGTACLRMQTWEDLMAMQAESLKCDDSVIDGDSGRSGRPGHQHLTHMIRLLKPRRGAVFQSKGNIDLPIWQRVIQDEMKREEIKSGRKVKDFKKKKIVNGEMMLKETKEAFIKTKTKSLDRLERELETKIDCFKERMNFLKISLFAEEDFKHMRSMVKNWQMALNASNARPTKWFESLCNDQKSHGLGHDVQVSSKIKDLLKFSKVEMTSIANLKAKLCLLVMSFPVYDICQPSMQEALKFFLESIMEKSPNNLEDWMLHRKLLMNNISVK